MTSLNPALVPAANPLLRTTDWFKGATRWTQLTFVEDDPAHVDPEFWIEVMKQSKSNAVCISAGGYMAFYPSKIQHHYRSKFLADRDLFGEVVDGARSLGMHVVARVDPHAIHADAAAAHPEWLARDFDGNAVPHWAFPDIWITCPFSTYNTEFMSEVMQELVREYDIDAVFANRWQGEGISYSQAARTQFREDLGKEMPQIVPGGDPRELAEWGTWRKQKLSELVGLWNQRVKAVKPHTSVIPNLGSLSVHELDRDLIGKHYPLFFIDRQGRDGVEPLWSAGRNAKRARGVFPDRPVGLITSVGPESHKYRWKDSVSPGAETAMWIVSGFAQGALPWFTKFNGKVADDRWVEPIISAYDLHARIEPALLAKTITAEVAVLDPGYPLATQLPGEHPHRDHDDGFYHALVEARIPFEYIAQHEITEARLAEYKVFVLPNARELSSAQIRTLEDFVAAGGSVVAAHESGLPQNDSDSATSLQSLLGITAAGERGGVVKNNYLEIQRPPHSQPGNWGEELIAGFDGTTRIIGGTKLIDVQAHESATVPFRFIPDFPDLPMEEVYQREPAGAPGVIATENLSGGRTLYFAFNVGSLFWEAMQPDHGRLIANAVRWALNREPQVSSAGPGLAELAVYESETEVTACLVNLTNPMAMKGPLREVIPLSQQHLTFRVPAGRRIGSVRSEVGGQELPFVLHDHTVEVALPPVELLEVVTVVWESGS